MAFGSFETMLIRTKALHTIKQNEKEPRASNRKKRTRSRPLSFFFYLRICLSISNNDKQKQHVWPEDRQLFFSCVKCLTFKSPSLNGQETSIFEPFGMGPNKTIWRSELEDKKN